MSSAEKDGDATAAFYAGLALRNLLLSRLYTQKFLTDSSRSHVERVRKEYGIMGRELDTLDRELQDPERRRNLAESIVAGKAYITAFEEIVAVVEKRNQLINDQLDRIGPEIAGLIEEVKLEIKGVQDQIGPRVQASGERATRLILWVSLFAVLMGIAMVFLVTRSLLKQLGGDPAEIAKVARRIAEGDLSQAFNQKNGKKAEGVYGDMETMTARLKEMFSEIASGVETLSISSTELSAVSARMRQGAEETVGKSETVAAAGEQMNCNMNSVAAAMEQTSANVQMVAAAAEEMTGTVSEIARSSEQAGRVTGSAVNSARKVSESVDALGDSASRIGEVVETINGISEQVNLLALNATIEAARAGDAGKGFAVVANEIKDLARETAEATGEIRERIDGIQGATHNTVIEIKEIRDVIGQVNENVSSIAAAVEEQSGTTNEIASNVNQATAGIREVNETVAQTSSAAGEIAGDIANVNTAAGEISNASHQVDTSARGLAELAEQLERMISRFRLS